MMDDLASIDPDYRSNLLKEFGFEEEEVEITTRQFVKSGFPKPLKRFNLVWEVSDLNIEEPYFWIVNFLKEWTPIVEKLEDSFAAAENSAFFGVTQVRLGGQQDKVSQFLATTGKMIKELFQMVRELRIIKERIDYYKGADEQLSKPVSERKKGEEITLKGMFVDLVQGGGKSAASIYGMAQNLEYVTLPDLFFDAPPFKNMTELENHIKRLSENFNKNVLRVLQRHLTQFLYWKKRTSTEHANRERFMLQYLWQHFEIIKMYIQWVKPYLRHVARLTMKEKHMSSPDIISAFEGSMLDVELLSRKRNAKAQANGCILATFKFRTRPEMKVVQEAYQRGPVHVGRFEYEARVYFWSDKQVADYKKLKQKETLLLMGEISSSVQSAMESLGEELDVYLQEARKEIEKKKEDKDKKESKKKSEKKGFVESFFGDFYTPKMKGGIVDDGFDQKKFERARDSVMNITFVLAHLSYRNFKKAHRMIET